MSLICWLPLNETTASNKGTSLLTISQSNITLGANGKFGNCFTFNGSNSTVTIAGTDLYNCFKGGTTPFSVCMWVYNGDGNGSTQANRAVFFGDYSLSGCINVNIEKTNAGLARFYWGGNPDWSVSGTTIAANAWTHLVFSYDGSNVYCYINGVLKGTRSGALAAKSKTSGNFQLGRDSRTGDTAFTGRMNDFRVYNHCLSLKEVKDLYKCLYRHYSLNFEDKITGAISTLTYAPASVGTSMIDNVGFGQTASLNNITASTDTAVGLCSAVFNGSNSYIEQNIILSGEDTTYTAWIKFDATGSYHIIDCRTSSGTGYQPFYGGTGYGLQFWSTNGAGLNITAAACAFNTTDWFFIAGTMSTTNGAKLYVNGELKGSAAAVKPGSYGTVPMRVGTRCTGANWFKGKIADVKVYSRELTADEISDLYKSKADIDKKGNLYGNTYIEYSGSDVILPTKKGVIRVEEFNEGASVFNVTETEINEANLYEKLL